MSTQKQIRANRQNSKKSTGPKSDQGKATVSQNAVKHGLFAESVIKGENPADYEAFHDKMLAELDPVGIVETMLAERVVSLWWRLRRAERMQNQSFDEFIEHQIDNPLSQRIRMINLHAKGVKMGDPRYTVGHLQLGRIATHDWSNQRVLDRMMLYERRIENSLTKIMHELERCQMIRQIELQKAYEQQFEPEQAIPIPINDNRDEAATQEAEKKGDLKKQNQSRPSVGNPKSEYLNPKGVKADTVLKKQSQLSVDHISVNSLVKGDYDRNSPVGEEQNKPNQSQLQTNAALNTGRSIHRSSKIQG